eukprot:m.211086 g.211086  ORF g.211086 m.211086 type:complete len:71 (+) comp13785_c0_seq1:1713-1925(+)
MKWEDSHHCPACTVTPHMRVLEDTQWSLLWCCECKNTLNGGQGRPNTQLQQHRRRETTTTNGNNAVIFSP